MVSRSESNQVYSKKFIEAVKKKSDIVSVISDFTHLEGKGGRYRGECPFNDSPEKSLLVSRDKQLFQCYECGASGDAISFVMKVKDASFNEAVEYLAHRANMQIPQTTESHLGKTERESTLSINREAARYYWRNMTDPQAPQGMEYLTSRGLDKKTINRFGIGYAKGESDGLYQYLRGKGYTDEQLIASGLISFYRDRGYDKFRDRVMCPIVGQNGDVLGFSGRVLDSSTPKYLNSPETLAFDKKRTLYGMNFAQHSQREGIILCEGNLDVISLHQAGFDNAVASLGTAFTYEQAFMIREKTDHVYLTFDSDSAGVKAAQRSIPIMKASGLGVSVVDLAPYKDPDELLKAEGASAFQARLDAAESSYRFEVRNDFQHWAQADEAERAELSTAFAKKMLNTPEEERATYIAALKEYMEAIPTASPDNLPTRERSELNSLSDMDRKGSDELSSGRIDISSLMDEYEIL